MSNTHILEYQITWNSNFRYDFHSSGHTHIAARTHTQTPPRPLWNESKWNNWASGRFYDGRTFTECHRKMNEREPASHFEFCSHFRKEFLSRIFNAEKFSLLKLFQKITVEKRILCFEHPVHSKDTSDIDWVWRCFNNNVAALTQSDHRSRMLFHVSLEKLFVIRNSNVRVSGSHPIPWFLPNH